MGIPNVYGIFLQLALLQFSTSVNNMLFARKFLVVLRDCNIDSHCRNTMYKQWIWSVKCAFCFLT
jgi:hypothetical protein